MTQKLIDADQLVDFDASKITSGILDLARIPNLDTSKITSGTFADARIAVTNVTQYEGSINHDALLNFVSNEHINHTSVSITAGAGLTGGGTIAATRTLDVGAGTGITVNSNDVALDTANTRNVDHASVTLTAGNGLSGGGTIAANRTFTVNTQNSVTISSDSVQLVNDVNSPGNDKVYGTNSSGTKGWYDAGGGFSSGQTWTEYVYSARKSDGTVYTNGNTYPISVSVEGLISGGNDMYMETRANSGSSWKRVAAIETLTSGTVNSTLTMIVPAGWQYHVRIDATSFTRWFELS